MGEPAHFSWAGLVANTVGAATASAVGLPTAYDVQHGFGGNLGEDFAGGLLDGAVTREISQTLGDNHVQSWQQIAEDAFGNALGNAAVGAINASNAQSAVQQQPTPSLLSTDNANSTADPVAAFDDGPYANMGNIGIGDGVSDAQMAAYMSSGLPTLASVGNAATFAAVNGGGPEPVDVTTQAFLANAQTGALSQLDYDAQWMNYANAMAQQPGGVPDAASISATQVAYNAAANSDAAANGGQYDPVKVQALDDALNHMIDANGWSFGAGEQASNATPIQTMPAITVTTNAAGPAQGAAGTNESSTFTFNPTFDVFQQDAGLQFDPAPIDWGASGSYGLANYTAAAAGSDEGGSVDALTSGLALAGTTADVGHHLGSALGKPWRVIWKDSGISAPLVLQNGGRSPAWLANPDMQWSVAPDASHAAVDLSNLGKAAHWLEWGGNLLGAAGSAIEIGDGLVSDNMGELGHGGVDGTVLAYSALGGPGGFLLSLAWTGVDLAVQQYSYKGQKGWTALWHSAWDSQDQMQQQDPKFYRQLWMQPKE